MAASSAYQLLKAVETKYSVKFREFQEAAYLKILQGFDVFVFAPTGSGKTYCFAFLSELLRLASHDGRPTTTIVISPLTSLMLEQVNRLKELGIKAAFVGELQDDINVKKSVVRGDVEVLLLTPEAIFESEWRNVLSSEAYRGRIKAVVVDEAHCIVHW